MGERLALDLVGSIALALAIMSMTGLDEPMGEIMSRFNGLFTAPGKIAVIEEPGIRPPVSLPEDSVCLNCQDGYNEKDLIEGKCFQCRYSNELKSWR